MADPMTQEPRRVPVFVISPSERLRLQVGDTTFWYRRLPVGKRADLVQEHLGEGVIGPSGATALEKAMAQYCLRGWDNLLDANHQPIPFLEEVIDYLPLEVLQKVNELANETSPADLVEGWRARQQASTPDTTP